MLSATMIREAEVLSIFSVAISVCPRVQGIFEESETYYNVSGFLPGPVMAQKGQYLRIARVDSRGRLVAVEGTDAPAGGAGIMVEPAEEDIPKVFFGWTLPQTKEDAVMPLRYISKTQDIRGYCKTKAQGNSSMNYPKKNQTVKLYKDADCTEKLEVDFKGWGNQNKFCFKANWIDLTHARNIVSARLWGDVVKSRADYDSIPEQLKTSPNQGAVDGFPVKVYAEGIYQGRYTVNIPKDAWMANMDEEQEAHCILCGENYDSGCFRAEANIDESDWTDEVHDTVLASIKNRWNDAIRFVMNSSDEEFLAGIGQYFDIKSLIDYYIFGLVSCGLDAFWKNQLYMTWDGMKWFATMYDMDSTWGLYWNGNSFVASTYARNEYEDFKHNSGNLLYIRLEQLFWDDIKARWEDLKPGVLSVERIINRFERFTDITAPYLVEEDYAQTTAGGSFTGIPQTETNNIQQIRSFVSERLAYVEGVLSGGRYPLKDAYVSLGYDWGGNDQVRVTTSGGNHVKVWKRATSNDKINVNLSDLTKNVYAKGNEGFAGDPIFTLKAGDTVLTKKINTVVESESSTASQIKGVIFFRGTNGAQNTSAEYAFGQDAENEITIGSDFPVNGVGLWIAASSAVFTFDFDLEIYVNGIRYV